MHFTTLRPPHYYKAHLCPPMMTTLIAEHLLLAKDALSFTTPDPHLRLQNILDLLMEVLPLRIYLEPHILSTLLHCIQLNLYQRMAELQLMTDLMAHL